MNRNTIILGDFNTSLTSMDTSSRQKINTATEALNDTIDHLDLISIYRTLHPPNKQNTHSFQACKERSLGEATY